MFKKVCFVSFSGGKDSTLTLSLALETYGKTGNVPVIPIFMDTMWEHPKTYEYIDKIERLFGIRIHRLIGYKGGLPALIKKKGIFPSVKRRFCTEILKLKPQFEFIRHFYFSFPFEIGEFWVGIRKEESRARENTEDYLLKAGEKDSRFRYARNFPFDLLFKYPIKDLTSKEVFEELNKRKIPVNPLYDEGFKRVGCFPCFLQQKEILKVLESAYAGDPFSKKRVKEMEELNSTIRGRIHINYNLEQLKRKATQRAKQAELKARLYALPI